MTGGLHVLGGGTLEGRHLASPAPPEASKIHAVLLGAAAPNDVLLPGMPHERAWTQVERLVITFNPNEAACSQSVSPFLWGRGGPSALGSTGVVDVARLGPAREKLVQLDLRNALNRNHGWKYYSSSPQVAEISHGRKRSRYQRPKEVEPWRWPRQPRYETLRRGGSRLGFDGDPQLLDTRRLTVRDVAED